MTAKKTTKTAATRKTARTRATRTTPPFEQQLEGSPLAQANGASGDNIPDHGNSDGSAKVPAKRKPRTAKKTDAEPKAKKLSALDAAAKVLGDAAQAMTCQEMIDAMAAQDYWTSPGGKTPAQTLYAAILRETLAKGQAARFVKTDRGKFALAGGK